MTDTAQLEMRIHEVKDQLGQISAKLDVLEKDLHQSMGNTIQIKSDLDRLKGAFPQLNWSK